MIGELLYLDWISWMVGNKEEEGEDDGFSCLLKFWWLLISLMEGMTVSSFIIVDGVSSMSGMDNFLGNFLGMDNFLTYCWPVTGPVSVIMYLEEEFGLIFNFPDFLFFVDKDVGDSFLGVTDDWLLLSLMDGDEG